MQWNGGAGRRSRPLQRGDRAHVLHFRGAAEDRESLFPDLSSIRAFAEWRHGSWRSGHRLGFTIIFSTLSIRDYNQIMVKISDYSRERDRREQPRHVRQAAEDSATIAAGQAQRRLVRARFRSLRELFRNNSPRVLFHLREEGGLQRKRLLVVPAPSEARSLAGAQLPPSLGRPFSRRRM